MVGEKSLTDGGKKYMWMDFSRPTETRRIAPVSHTRSAHIEMERKAYS